MIWSEGSATCGFATAVRNGSSLRAGRTFDTPSLQGNCPDTLVSRQIPMKRQGILKHRIWLDTGREKTLEASNG